MGVKIHYATIHYNESKHNILTLIGNAKKKKLKKKVYKVNVLKSCIKKCCFKWFLIDSISLLMYVNYENI
jgi:hypothetical protein